MNRKIEGKAVTQKLKKEIDNNSTSKLIKIEHGKQSTSKRAVTIVDTEKRYEKRQKIESSSCCVENGWAEFQLLAELQYLELGVAKNLVHLFEDGMTIPFIARYRGHLSNNMPPNKLREIKEQYESICFLKKKINSTLKAIQKSENASEAVLKSIAASRSIEELEYMYAPYKPDGKKTLAAKAKELGLEKPAMMLLHNNITCNLSDFVQTNNKELATIKEVEKKFVHIIASVIATNTEMLSFIRDARTKANFMLKTSEIKSKTEKNEASKFENYFNFDIPLKFLKPHQILAINRGESLKILSVKITVPHSIYNSFESFCRTKWLNGTHYDDNRQRILYDAINDSYQRLVQPLITREIRAELKLKAERASCDVFSTNLKHLLLAPPFKGKKILGIDPGFSHGCKLALVSEMGNLLDHSVIYPFKSTKKTEHVTILKNMLLKHQCSFIALGNGTACRQTEEWLSGLIKQTVFRPLDVTYTIVNEAGASIYSCSPEAQKEFPDLDPNIISAISVARRIQEPLAELVKVEPRHLGVGMYQHDLKKKNLEESLNHVVSECVSFIGIDLNTTSQCLLKHVAGLSDKRAAQIISYRNENGQFINRKQLLEIKGIGQKVFQQCAGFLRVPPTNVETANEFYRNPKTTKLDCTYIHPESYDLAYQLTRKLHVDINNIGQSDFINQILKTKASLNLLQLSAELNSSEETIQLIVDTFCKPLNHDLRNDYPETPLFRQSITDMECLNCGTILTGRINNVTHFGCFVDVGVGTNGLIHMSKMKGLELQIGNRVEVRVINLDLNKKRIGCELIKLL